MLNLDQIEGIGFYKSWKKIHWKYKRNMKINKNITYRILTDKWKLAYFLTYFWKFVWKI